MKISFPHIGNYYIPVYYLLSNTMDLEVVIPPKMTNKTRELGNKYSPDFICSPFKYTLGSIIESNSDIALQLGGGCKYGYYFEMQQKILKDENINTEIINLISCGKTDFKEIYLKLKKYLKKGNLRNLKYLINSFNILKYMDDLEFKMREKGIFLKEYNDFLDLILKKEKMWKIKKKYKNIKSKIKKNVENRENSIKIGIVGELYTIMEPFANYYTEENLIKRKIKITREVNATYLLFKKKRKMKKEIKKSKYITSKMGADASDNVCKVEKYCKEGYDAILHIKSSFCTPEIAAMPLIEKVCKDYDVPVLFLSFDTNSNEAAVSTRIEALLDLIEMRKNNE